MGIDANLCESINQCKSIRIHANSSKTKRIHANFMNPKNSIRIYRNEKKSTQSNVNPPTPWGLQACGILLSSPPIVLPGAPRIPLKSRSPGYRFGVHFWNLFWNPLFCFLEPKKRSFERLLGAPEGISRQVSAILGAKKLPKRSPGGPKSSSGGDQS